MAPYSTSSLLWLSSLRSRRWKSSAFWASSARVLSATMSLLNSPSARSSARAHNSVVCCSSFSSGEFADLRGTGRLFLGIFLRVRLSFGVEGFVQFVEQVGGFILGQAEVAAGAVAADRKSTRL